MENQQVGEFVSEKFTWTIENFSKLNTQKLYSKVFLIGDWKWYFDVSPAVYMLQRDEKTISRAIELNEHLQKVLTRHDALLSSKPTSTVNHLNQDQAEEEEEAA